LAIGGEPDEEGVEASGRTVQKSFLLDALLPGGAARDSYGPDVFGRLWQEHIGNHPSPGVLAGAGRLEKIAQRS
jgi:hypothetical protein